MLYLYICFFNNLLLIQKTSLSLFQHLKGSFFMKPNKIYSFKEIMNPHIHAIQTTLVILND